MTSSRLLLPIGLLSGILGGLLGIGGGGVMVPLLVGLAGCGQRHAHAVSLGAVVPLALAATLVYGAADDVRIGTAAIMFAGGAIGAPMGARLLSHADDNQARKAFGALLVCLSVYLFAT